jgi:hypothetical protein
VRADAALASGHRAGDCGDGDGLGHRFTDGSARIAARVDWRSGAQGRVSRVAPGRGNGRTRADANCGRPPPLRARERRHRALDGVGLTGRERRGTIPERLAGQALGVGVASLVFVISSAVLAVIRTTLGLRSRPRRKGWTSRRRGCMATQSCTSQWRRSRALRRLPATPQRRRKQDRVERRVMT